MKRGIAFAALGLGGIGMAACLAGLIGIWVVRPSVLRSGAEIVEAADGGLQLVVEKAARADELVKRILGSVVLGVDRSGPNHAVPMGLGAVGRDRNLLSFLNLRRQFNRSSLYRPFTVRIDD